jgi:predicted unusual protein kinase regulating ubiquinone biosynthesis (AarF/ABC1/UbiB family)
VKKASEICGPIGQKLLQFLVMHEGFLSSDSKDKLSYIFENCNTHPWRETEQIYFRDFGKYIDEDFYVTKSDTCPIGSGTIGQVYKLYSLQHNNYVALKVRHYNVEEEAAIFIKTITTVIAFVNNITFIPFTLLIHDFLDNIGSQLDYGNEALNTELLRKNNLKNPHIVIPTVYFHSERVICMSYHEGISFTEITDKFIKTKVSLDILMFNLSSILINDLMHCDLHYGNWKVNIDTGDDYQIIIYDCGIMGSTFNDDINKRICMACMNGDYNTIYTIIAKDINQPNGIRMKQYTENIMNTYYENKSDRFSDFLKQLFVYKINFNKRYFRCIQGLMTCLSVMIISSEKLSKILGKEGSRLEVFLCYYSGILEKIKKYPELLNYLNIWMETDKSIESTFYQWLEEYFGHTDKSVFVDAVLYKLLKD